MAETYFNLRQCRQRTKATTKPLKSGCENRCKSLKNKARANNVHPVSARLLSRRHDFGFAEELYRKSAQKSQSKNGNDEYEANSYQRLGFLACQQCDYEASKKWYEKAFEIYEKRGDMDRAAKLH